MEKKEQIFQNCNDQYRSADFFTSVEKDVDFTWIYYGWDGVAAELKNLDLNFIKLQDLDPDLDFYTPVIVAHEELLSEEPDLARKFLKATAKGYQYAIEHPEEAAQCLLDNVPELDEISDCQPKISQRVSRCA